MVVGEKRKMELSAAEGATGSSSASRVRLQRAFPLFPQLHLWALFRVPVFAIWHASFQMYQGICKWPKYGIRDVTLYRRLQIHESRNSQLRKCYHAMVFVIQQFKDRRPQAY